MALDPHPSQKSRSATCPNLDGVRKVAREEFLAKGEELAHLSLAILVPQLASLDKGKGILLDVPLTRPFLVGESSCNGARDVELEPCSSVMEKMKGGYDLVPNLS